MIPARQPQQEPLEVLNRLKDQAKAEWVSCDRGTEDSFAYIIDVLFPLAEMQMVHTSPPAPEQYCKYDSRTSPKHVCESCRGLRPRWCTLSHTSPPAPHCLCVECSYSARSAKSCRHTLAGEDKRKIAEAERERTIKEFESWNPFRQSFKDFVESLRAQLEQP